MPLASTFKDMAETSAQRDELDDSFLSDFLDDILEENSGQPPQVFPESPFSPPSDNQLSDQQKPDRFTPHLQQGKDLVRIIEDEFLQKLPQLEEYLRLGYNLNGLDRDALNRLEGMLHAHASEAHLPAWQGIIMAAETYLQQINALVLPAEPSPERQKALEQANSMTAMLCLALETLGVAGAAGGEKQEDSVVSEQLHALADEAKQTLAADTLLTVDESGYIRTRTESGGLLRGESSDRLTENPGFKTLTGALLAEDRVMRIRLAAYLEDTAEQLRQGSGEARDYALRRNWDQVLLPVMSRIPPYVTRISRSLLAVRPALNKVVEQLRQQATDLRPSVETRPDDESDWGDDMSALVKAVPKKWEGFRQGASNTFRSVSTGVEKTAWQVVSALGVTPVIRSEGARRAVKDTGLLLLDELHQLERRLLLLPAASRVLEETVEQRQRLLTPVAHASALPVLDTLLAQKLAQEAESWRDNISGAEEKIRALLAPLTRFAQEKRGEEFWYTLSGELRQRRGEKGEWQGFRKFDGLITKATGAFSAMANEVEGEALRLAGHGYAGDRELMKKIRQWQHDLKHFKAMTRKVLAKVTGETLDYYSRRGMLARDVASWAQALKQDYLRETQPEDREGEAARFEQIVTSTVRDYAGKFSKASDRGAEGFRRRLALELRHAADGTTTWPLTPGEILAGTRSVSDDIERWAQKKVVSGAISALIRQGFKVVSSPFSVLGGTALRLIRGGVTLYLGIRAIKRGVRVGQGPATREIKQFAVRKTAGTMFRVVMSASPVLGWGVSATITGTRLLREEGYARKFLTETLEELPEDMLWRGGYALGNQLFNRVFRKSKEEAFLDKLQALQEAYSLPFTVQETEENIREGFHIGGDDNFRAAVRQHLGEIQKTSAGRTLIRAMHDRTIDILPPREEDLLRTAPDGRRYYNARTEGNTLYFDPYNTFYGKSEAENPEAWRHVDPGIVLYHELLHIQTGETGHQHIVPSDPHRLDENDYRREYYASRGQDVVERAWDPDENDDSAARYVRDLRGGNLTTENVSPQQWYINRKIDAGYSGIKPPGSLSVAPEEGEKIDAKQFSNDIAGQPKSPWIIYLNGKYWPVTENANNKLSVRLGDEDRNLELVPGSTKKWRLTDDDDIWDKYYADHVLYQLPNDFTESGALNYLTQVRKGESRHYRKVEHFSARVQAAEIKQQQTIAVHQSVPLLPLSQGDGTLYLQDDPGRYSGNIHHLSGDMHHFSEQVNTANDAKAAKNVAAEKDAETAYAGKTKYIADMHQQFNTIEIRLTALPREQHVYVEKIAALKKELKILTESETANMRADASQRQTLLKYEINYLLWLRKQLDDEFKVGNMRLDSLRDLPFSDFSDEDKQKAFYNAMKHVLVIMENDSKLPPTSRVNAYEARMGKERVTPVDIYGYDLPNCFFIPDKMGSKSGVLVDFDSEWKYYYVQQGTDLRLELISRFSSKISDVRYNPDGPSALNAVRRGTWKYEEQFNSNDPIRTDIKTLSGQMAKRYDRSENKSMRKLAVVGESIDDADFNAIVEIYTGDENQGGTLMSYYLHHISNPAEYMAWKIQSNISINAGDSVEVARKKIIRAKRIGEWVDVTAAGVAALVPGGQVVLLTQAIASMAADIADGKTPNGLALASAIVALLPGAKIVKYVGEYSRVAAGGVKYGIMISGHVIDITGMYRSISLAIETKDPLHIYQACISSGLSAKAAYDTSKDIFQEIRSPKNARPKVSQALEGGHENIEMSTFRISQEASEGKQETSFTTSQKVSEGTGDANSNTLNVIREPDGGYVNNAMTNDDDIRRRARKYCDDDLPDISGRIARNEWCK